MKIGACGRGDMNEGNATRRDVIALGLAALGSACAQQVQAGDRRPHDLPADDAPLALVSRHLQWTSAEDGIAIAAKAGFPSIAWTVRPGAHVAPDAVETELPRIVSRTRAAGLATPLIITAINDVDSPGAEAILATMQSLGIRLYRIGAPRYDYKREFAPQYAEFRARLQRLARLNARYGVTAVVHTHSYANTIGGSAWDLWMVLQDLDPDLVAINFDIGHVTAKGGAGWRDSLHAAHAHVRAFSVKDFHWVRRLDAGLGEWPWQTEFVRPGDGMVNFAAAFSYLKAIRFSGPIETYYEYKVEVPGRAAPVDMLGTDFGKWQLEMPREMFVSLLKRDVDFYKAAYAKAAPNLES